MMDGCRMSVWSHRPLVELHLPLSEVGKLLEGIDGDQNGADVCLGAGTRLRTRTSKCGEVNIGHDSKQCCIGRLASNKQLFYSSKTKQNLENTWPGV